MQESAKIDELRHRIKGDPGSRLFAQLAEELRKAGDLQEAIRVCRDGLVRHPRYWTARLTLARALLESSAVEEASNEFKTVLEGAPDNILARRSLGECLERMGDLRGAVAQYKEALLYSPGDEWCRKKVEELTALRSTERGVSARPETPKPKGEHIEAKRASLATELSGEPPPIRLVEADEEFELERPLEAPTGSAAPTEEQRPFGPDAGKAEQRAETLASPTLAELYLAQGHLDRAVDVYRQMIERSPEDRERYDQRYRELRQMSKSNVEVSVNDRKEAILRTILRLETMLAAVHRSRRDAGF